jgi:hypothetical protein
MSSSGVYCIEYESMHDENSAHRKAVIRRSENGSKLEFKDFSLQEIVGLVVDRYFT